MAKFFSSEFDWNDFDSGTAWPALIGGSGESFAAPLGLPPGPPPTTYAAPTTTTAATATSTTTSSSLSWLSKLTNASIEADFKAAISNGAVTEAGLTKLLKDLAASLTSSKTTLTASELTDLKTIAANLNNGVATSAYLTYVFNALVNGNAANASWTGGAARSVALGNLGVGSSATQLTELTGKWLQGTDLPSDVLDMSGYTPVQFSYSTVSNESLYATGSPSINDINQGYLGDCYFLASAGEVALENASEIASAITSNGDGTYGVRFYYDGKAEYVTVNSALPDGGTLFNSASDLWASLMEKAYVEFQSINLDTGNNVNYGNSWSTIGNGGDPAYALEALTGDASIQEFTGNGSSWTDKTVNDALQVTGVASGESSTTLLATLIADLAAHDNLVLASNTTAKDSSGKYTLVADHAFSIVGYDSSTGALELRNPWGTESGQTWDTTFEVSLKTLLSAKDEIVVA
jgi:hypothetical protein